MFRKAIKESLNYIRPFLIGKLYYNNIIANDITTLIVLNKNGDILTTSKNADIFSLCNDYNEIYPNIIKEIKEAKPRNIPKLEKKYGIDNNTIIDMKNILIDISDNPGKLKIIKHDNLDLAIISIENKDNILVKNYPKFSKNKPEVGTSVCTIGFAFPEYKAFTYDEENYNLKSKFDFMNFPIFPTDGIICRNIADSSDNISMFEMTNLIITGQEGGPVINKEGFIEGMIIGSKLSDDHGFKIKTGIAINNIEIMKFLDDNNIEYEVENEE